MEKVVRFLKSVQPFVFSKIKLLKQKFIKDNNNLTHKKDIDFKNLSILFFSLISIFMAVGLFMPAEDSRVFREVANNKITSDQSLEKSKFEITDEPNHTASKIWNNERSYQSQSRSTQVQVNYNTSMVMGESKGNAQFELAAGTRLRIQILEKFLASQEGSPVMAKLLESVTSASGNEIPEGSILYGEASYQKASSKALITFKQVSYPNGTQHDILAKAVGEDGIQGISGSVKSDSIKNSVGQVITNFVGSMASGSVERDFMGQSKGGNTNGMYQAISEAARDRAQKFGESLKESREWIEIDSGVLCEAILQSPYKLIQLNLNNDGGSRE